jgi:hypothetical protein
VLTYRQHSWPFHPKPPYIDWLIWRKVLREVYLGSGRNLRNKLGHWLSDWYDWEWYYNPAHKLLYWWTLDGWQGFCMIDNCPTLPIFNNEGFPMDSLIGLCRATVYTRRGTLICSGFSPIRAKNSRHLQGFPLLNTRYSVDYSWTMTNRPKRHY